MVSAFVTYRISKLCMVGLQRWVMRVADEVQEVGFGAARSEWRDEPIL